MNLTFDLQLFGTTNPPTIKGGFSGGSKEYDIGSVVLSGEFNTGTSKFANFATTALGVPSPVGAWNGTAGITGIYFNGDDSSANASMVGILDSGENTWNLTSADIGGVVLGDKVKLNLMKAPSAGVNATLAAAGSQEITFGTGTVAINVVTVNSASGGNQLTSGTVKLKGGASDVSLLANSSLEGSTIVGEAGGVISLKSANGDLNTFNLKGSSSEAVVTIGGAGASTVHSSSVDGFTKITFNAKKGEGAEISLSGIKDSGVNIIGSDTTTASAGDKIIIGSDVKRSSISITGGSGADKITLSGTGAELIIMNSLTSGDNGDSVTGWLSTDGDVEKGNTLKIDSVMSTFYAKNVTGAQVIVGQGADSSSATTDKIATTLDSSATNASTNYAFGVNVKAVDDTYSALLVGNKALTSVQGVKFDKYNYIIADQNQTLDLGTTGKTTVVLANTADEKHWGDNYNVYQNIVNITSSSKGKSFIVNGKENESINATLKGSNDSIWGANNLVADNISLTTGKDQIVFSGAGDGLDSVKDYVYGTSASKANAIRFLDGIGYVAADKNALVFGADENNGVSVSLAGTSTGNKVAYGFGTEGDKYVALVDATTTSDGKITYGSDVNVYIGQGDGSFISVDSAAKDVKLGWDGGAGYVSIGGVIGELAADGAVIVGSTDNAQTISGSSRGASSISGGFVADEWTDKNADVLIGGNVATKSTTFFVGKDMGKDEIQNLSSKDNIVFLGTKYEDLVNFNPEATDTDFTFKFANNNVIEATAGTKKLSAIKDVSLYFDDGTYIWNGSKIEKAE